MSKARILALACGLVPFAGSLALGQAQFQISIGIRETGTTEPIGANGGAAGGIEWINLDGFTISADGSWNTLTFNFGSDPVTSFVGNGVIDGTRGTLEHIRIRNIDGSTLPYNFFIDDVVNTVGGADTVLNNFDDPAYIVDPKPEVMFQEASFSGSTNFFVGGGTGTFANTLVTDLAAVSGTQSNAANFSFASARTDAWVRLTTFGTTSNVQPNPAIDFSSTSTLSLKIRAEAAAPTRGWAVDADGNFSEPTNWIGDLIPGTGTSPNYEIAYFRGVNTAARTINFDFPLLMRGVVFDSANGYTLSGSETLILDSSAGGGNRIVLVAGSGSHTISVPIQFGKTVDLSAGAGATLNLTGDLDFITLDATTSAFGVVKTGAGEVVVKNLRLNTTNTAGAAVTLLAGKLTVADSGPGEADAGTSIIRSISASGGGQLNLENNDLIVNYGSEATPYAAVRGLIASGFAGGAWNGQGIVSDQANASAFGLGYSEASTLGVTSFSGQTVDDTAVLVKYTYYGDTNLDGQVDVTDLGNLATNWQLAGDWIAGDFNYDGVIDVADLGALATNWQAGVGGPLAPDASFHSALTSVGLSVIPEPASLSLLALGALALRRRK